MGFPIRKFTDQSLFAAPRNLSQRTTSFIASQRQGIHRMPLRHLIVLIFDTYPVMELAPSPLCGVDGGGTVLRDPLHGIKAILKTSLLRIIRRRRGHAPTDKSTERLATNDVSSHR